MHADRRAPDLERLAAEQVAHSLTRAAVGAPLAADSSAELCGTLERLIPEMLRREHPEWGHESIDGFFFSSAVKIDEVSAELAGTCILISDQTVTPFALSISLSDSRAFQVFRIRLGEAGNGPLGISGPECNSRAARKLFLALNARLERVDWVYDLTM